MTKKQISRIYYARGILDGLEASEVLSETMQNAIDCVIGDIRNIMDELIEEGNSDG